MSGDEKFELGTDDELREMLGDDGLEFLGRGLARPNRTWVYRLYGWSGLLLYVGCTNDVDRRLKEHRRLSPWYALADNARTTWLDGPAAAHQAERDAIRTEHPLFNRVEYVDQTPYETTTLASAAEAEGEIADGIDFLFGQMFNEENIKSGVNPWI